MKHSSWMYALAGLCGIMLFTGCRSTAKNLVLYDAELAAGNYDAAAQLSSDMAEKRGGSGSLWHLLAGNSLLLLGDFDGSIHHFDAAEDAFSARYGHSGFSRSMSILANEAALDYVAQGQDRIFCCLYKALEYMASGNVAAARTEFNRAGDHQENWLFERRMDRGCSDRKLEAEIAASRKKGQGGYYADNHAALGAVLDNADFSERIRKNCGFDIASSGKLDSISPNVYMNAYLSHFCGVFRWVNRDGARSFLRDALRCNPNNPVLAQDFRLAEEGVNPNDCVWIYIEDGLCPKREEWRLDLPIGAIPGVGAYAVYAGMALPVLAYRFPACSNYSVCDGTNTYGFSLLENMDRLLKLEYDVYMQGALKREIMRALVKVGGQLALAIAANNARDDSTRLALQLAMCGTGLAAAATTAADVRCWLALPKTIWVQRLNRPKDGKMDIVAAMPSKTEILHLEIPEGNSVVWIRKLTESTNMVAKVMTFAALP